MSVVINPLRPEGHHMGLRLVRGYIFDKKHMLEYV